MAGMPLTVVSKAGKRDEDRCPHCGGVVTSLFVPYQNMTMEQPTEERERRCSNPACPTNEDSLGKSNL